MLNIVKKYEIKEIIKEKNFNRIILFQNLSNLNVLLIFQCFNI